MLWPYKKHSQKNYNRIMAEIAIMQVYMFPVTNVLGKERLPSKMNRITRLKNSF